MAEGKWISGLTPEMPVADAAKLVLTERFAVVRHYLPLAAERAWENAEFVHQLRVGTRRAGAALRAFAGALPRKSLKAMRHTLRALRQSAGDARDWDVFLVTLSEAKTFGAVAAKPALDFLLGYALGERAAAQTRLVLAANKHGPDFRELSEALPLRTRAPEGENAPPNVGALAARQLGSLVRDLTSESEANPTEPAALHELRITGKRLRYALEIFADCFPPFLKDSVYPSVERVQGVLGDVQDATVGAARLLDIRARIGAALPKQLTRVKKGLDGLATTLRAKVPAGTTAFATWREEWSELMTAMKLEVLATTV